MEKNIVDKFIKLIEIGVFPKCFVAEFSNFFSIMAEILLLGGPLWIWYQTQAFQGFSWNFPIFYII